MCFWCCGHLCCNETVEPHWCGKGCSTFKNTVKGHFFFYQVVSVNCEKFTGVKSLWPTGFSIQCVLAAQNQTSQSKGKKKNPNSFHFFTPCHRTSVLPSQLASRVCRCDTRSSFPRYSFPISPSLSISPPSISPTFAVYATLILGARGVLVWSLSAQVKGKKNKTRHAFRAQLPNASHYYRSSSTITPWGKGEHGTHAASHPPPYE